jgi:hypothetical protein
MQKIESCFCKKEDGVLPFVNSVNATPNPVVEGGILFLINGGQKYEK